MFTHAHKCQVNCKQRMTLFFALLDCGEIFSVHPLPKKIKGFSLWGDWKCSKLIQQKCSCWSFIFRRPPLGVPFILQPCVVKGGWRARSLQVRLCLFSFLSSAVSLLDKPGEPLTRLVAGRILAGAEVWKYHSWAGWDAGFWQRGYICLPQLQIHWMNPPLTDLITLSCGSSDVLLPPFSFLCDHRD